MWDSVQHFSFSEALLLSSIGMSRTRIKHENVFSGEDPITTGGALRQAGFYITGMPTRKGFISSFCILLVSIQAFPSTFPCLDLMLHI